MAVNGVIPAQAGQRAYALDLARWPRGHPRTGGAEPASSRRATQRTGSSPHRRGRGDCMKPDVAIIRVIPAQAGQREGGVAADSHGRGHPRTGGAEHKPSFAAVAVTGSSPHRRGRGSSSTCSRAEPGVIPAQAGQRSPTTRSDGKRTSSPHRRGRADAVLVVKLCDDVIPAQAGQSEDKVERIVLEGRHPRTGGAEKPDYTVGWQKDTSSPHRRGRVPDISPRRVQPARHPRTGGAEGIYSPLTLSPRTSSPHRRGRGR